ncbi:unnamed protein product, partial [Discosporangium mesarthrocarpum]
MKLTICAFGTRGDVQPLAILTGRLLNSGFCKSALFVSHAAHQDLMDSLLMHEAREKRPEFWAVDSPPVMWKGGAESNRLEVEANRRQEDACELACRGAGLIMYNLFAMEAFHIAESMKVPCVVCQPYLMPTPMPNSFPHRMRRAHPQLYRQLLRCNLQKTPPARLAKSQPVCRGRKVQWSDVEHWMWPLFTDRWGP